MKNKLDCFIRSLDWINKNTIDGNGITVTSKERVVYPEVSGYYIPTLLQWGERERAVAYAKYLCCIQKEDGAWYDSKDEIPYIFDTGQILKGLVSIYPMMPEVKENIIKGCDWIITNMTPEGRLLAPGKDTFPKDEDFYSELIHLYCLSPIKKAGELFVRPDYIEDVDKILSYYKGEKMEKIMNFSLLSHFYAYVMEALFDLGEIDLCRQAMMNLEKYRNKQNIIPGLNDVPWTCSTGLFQLAIVWYKLNDLDRGNSLFYYALSLQNKTGGWYGSYQAPGLLARFYRGRKKPYYFPKAEISWAVKYFLDALALKEKLEFEKQSPDFMDTISDNDGRYLLIKNLINASENKTEPLKICDVGCGKGRYLKRLVEECPNNDYYASDISEKVMSDITYVKEKRLGSMTNISYEDECFDFVYVCEAYEYSINLEAAFKELYRITKSGGKFVIIDKPIEKLGQLEIYEWEQWISDEDIRRFSKECGGELEIVKSVPYEGKDDGLFRAWIISKKIK